MTLMQLVALPALVPIRRSGLFRRRNGVLSWLDDFALLAAAEGERVKLLEGIGARDDCTTRIRGRCSFLRCCTTLYVRQDQPPPGRSKQLSHLSLSLAQAAKYFSLGEVHHGAGFLVRRLSLRRRTLVALISRPFNAPNMSLASPPERSPPMAVFRLCAAGSFGRCEGCLECLTRALEALVESCQAQWPGEGRAARDSTRAAATKARPVPSSGAARPRALS
jgi:hypothetical protein